MTANATEPLFVASTDGLSVGAALGEALTECDAVDQAVHRAGNGGPHHRSDHFFGASNRRAFEVAELVDHAGASLREAGLGVAVLIAFCKAATLASTVSRGGMSPKIIPDIAA